MLSRSNSRLRDLPGYAHQKHFTNSTKREMKLRPNLGPFVLELLHRQLLKSLVWLFKHPNTGLITTCEGGAYGAGEEHGEAACVIYLTPIFGPKIERMSRRVAYEVIEAELLGRRALGIYMGVHGRIAPGNDRIANMKDPPPQQNPAAVYLAPRYPTAYVAGRHVPVCGLHELLGKEKLRELVNNTEFEGSRCVVLRGGDARTVKAQMALLRLQHYLLQEGSKRDGGGQQSEKSEEEQEVIKQKRRERRFADAEKKVDGGVEYMIDSVYI